MSTNILKYDKKAFVSRAVSETVKSMCWKYMMDSDPFNTLNDKQDEKYFRQSLTSMCAQNYDICGLDLENGMGDLISSKMDMVKKLPFKQQLNIYLNDRVRDQEEWYRNKAKNNQGQANYLFFIVMVVQTIVLLVSIYYVQRVNYTFNPTGVFTTIVSAMMAWGQLKQYMNLSQAYGIAAHDLSAIYLRAKELKTKKDFSRYVTESEMAISREHTLWRARQLGA